MAEVAISFEEWLASHPNAYSDINKVGQLGQGTVSFSEWVTSHPEISGGSLDPIQVVTGLIGAVGSGAIIGTLISDGNTQTKGDKSKVGKRVAEKQYLSTGVGIDPMGNPSYASFEGEWLESQWHLKKKLAHMAQSFGIKVKDLESVTWNKVVKTWADITGFIGDVTGDPLDWFGVTKIGDKAKTAAKKSEFDALKKSLYDNGVLSEESGNSLMTGTWTAPATLHTVFPFKGDVATHIVDYYLNNYLQFSAEDATTIRNKINEYLAAHPDEGIFSITPFSRDFTYGSFSVNFASKNVDYNIKIEGKPESGSPILFGDITGLDHGMHSIKVNVSTLGTDYSAIGPADPSYIYPDKVRVTSISEGTESYPSALYRIMYGSTRECVAPVFSNGVLQDKFVDHNGTEHTFSGATENYGVLIGYDGSHISTVTREAVSDSSSKFYDAFSLAPITLDTTTNTLKDYIGKTINEIIKGLAKEHDKPYVQFAYGMQANKIVALSDNVNFEKTDENAELPKKDVDIMDQYANTWAKSAKTYGDVSIRDGVLHVEKETALPFPADNAATQTAAQAGTAVWDYAQNAPLEGARTVTESIPASAPSAITAALVSPAIVPIVPVATVLPEVLSGGSGAGLWQMYSPSASNISSFGKWLWENPVEGLTAPGDTLKKLFQNPMDAIISLHRVYVTPNTGGSQSIKVGYLDSGVSAPVITNRYVQKNLGSVTISSINGNFMDYEGVDMTIYLPFIGMRPLDTCVCMGATLTLTYNVDVLTGTCVAMLSVRKNNIKGVIYQWVGSMFESVPVTSANMNSAIQGTLGLVGSAVTTVAGAVAGGPAGAAVGVAGLASSASGIHTNIQSCGSIGGTAGALASRSAYITLTITQTYNPYNWKNVKGLPDNVTTSIGSQHGYIEGDNPTGYSGSMTQNEWNEFESLLAKGIYV